MIRAYSYASVGKEHYVLAPTGAEAIVARTKEDVFDGIFFWPGTVYELRVDPRDVLGRGAHVLRVRRYEVVGAVPRAQVFGKNVAALDAFIGDLGAFGWLRPSGEDRRPRAAALVAEHHAALGHYGRVPGGTSLMMHDVDEIDGFLRPPYKFVLVSREGLAARVKAHDGATRAVDRRLDARLKTAIARVAGQMVIPAAWRAAWAHVAAAHVDFTIARFREKDGAMLDNLGTMLLELTAKALDAAMEPGLEEMRSLRPADLMAGLVAEASVARARAEIPAGWGESAEHFSAVLGDMVRRVWFYSFSFATHASQQAAWHAFHLASGLREPDPWGPWLGLFRLGLWPLADNGVDMIVYEPRMTRE